ncbi:MAG TPA: L-lactate permease [Terrimicrobiaceae bacterium]
MIELLFAALPIAFLVVVMTKPKPLPSTIAFFLAAALAFTVRLAYFRTAFPLLNAAVIGGLLDALTPISIVFGAIFFFVALEKSGAMEVLQEWLRGISSNPVAQLMIVGWAFVFLIEGACGFGTPAALAAPILVGLGFPAMRVALLCLIFNAIPTPFGAVGTPMWFGFELLELPQSELIDIGMKTALLQSIAGLIIPVVSLRFVVDWTIIGRNLGFIYLSLLSCVIPMLAVASSNYEFPAVIGGVVGLIVTILLARFGVGLERRENGGARGPLLSGPVLVALTPLIATVVILLVTRIPVLGLRGLLTSTVPSLPISLGRLGEFAISPSLVVQLHDILGQGLNWSHAILYVPSIVPFFLTAMLAFFLFRSPAGTLSVALNETMARIGKPVIALFGALVFVNLLMAGGDRASTMILGDALASATGGAWKYFAPFLGALGSFFSGSTTISNLTFGGIQASIAQDIGMDPGTLLALQCAGAAMGNMICIHNIVAVCAVLALVNVEGDILKEAFLPVILYGITLAAAAALLF